MTKGETNNCDCNGDSPIQNKSNGLKIKNKHNSNCNNMMTPQATYDEQSTLFNWEPLCSQPKQSSTYPGNGFPTLSIDWPLLPTLPDAIESNYNTPTIDTTIRGFSWRRRGGSYSIDDWMDTMAPPRSIACQLKPRSTLLSSEKNRYCSSAKYTPQFNQKSVAFAGTSKTSNGMDTNTAGNESSVSDHNQRQQRDDFASHLPGWITTLMVDISFGISSGDGFFKRDGSSKSPQQPSSATTKRAAGLARNGSWEYLQFPKLPDPIPQNEGLKPPAQRLAPRSNSTQPYEFSLFL